MPDIEQRLRDGAASIAYPPTPDIVSAVARRLLAPQAEVGRRATRLAAAQGALPTSRPAETPIPLPGAPRRGQLPGQIARLAAAVIAFVIVGGLMALVFQMAGDPRDQLGGAGETVVQERLYVVSGYRFTAYDAETNEQIYWVSVNARFQTVGHDSGLHDIGRVMVFDTATWETAADLTLDPALTEPLTTGHAMTFSPDGTALYIAGTEFEPGTVNRVRSS